MALLQGREHDGLTLQPLSSAHKSVRVAREGGSVDRRRGRPQSGRVQRTGLHRALAVLTVGAFATLVVEATALGDVVLLVVLGAVFAGAAIAVPAWLDRHPSRRVLTWGYVVAQLALGFGLFTAAAAGVGATLLLMVLVGQAVLLLPLPAAVVVTLAVPLVHLGMQPADAVRNGMGVLAAAAFTAVVTELLQREQRARAELAAANLQLRRYAAQAEELATTRERNRLARDIHDGLGHHLTVIGMQVQAARAVLTGEPGRADAVLAGAQQQVSEALTEVRRSVGALREPRTAPPLAASLDVLAAESSAAGLPAEVTVTGKPRTLPAEVEESLFRAAQEGLTNVRKHAGASRARLLLDWSEPGTVRLRVADDGAGVPVPRDGAAGPGFGLLGLRERAERVGGRVVVGSPPGGGTTLDVEVPG
jgi:signal transduction histidine kinase